jgi:hypothetical protein
MAVGGTLTGRGGNPSATRRTGFTVGCIARSSSRTLDLPTGSTLLIVDSD